MRRFLLDHARKARRQQDLPTLLDFQRLTGAGCRCTGCALELAQAFDLERRRVVAGLNGQGLLFSEP
jgi:hypothetical protein